MRVWSIIAVSMLLIISTAQGMVVTMNGKAWTFGWDKFYDATALLNCTKTERIKGVSDLTCNTTVIIPEVGESWQFTMNGTQIEYNIHLIAGKDIGYIPPYLLTDLVSGRGIDIIQKYHLYVPLHGISLTGWNIGEYWTLTGVIVENKQGDLFKSWNAYTLYFRNNGDFGAEPTGDTYKDLVKRFIYYRTQLIEQVWKAMESMGLYEQYWNDLGAYLNGQAKIWKAVREKLGYYIP